MSFMPEHSNTPSAIEKLTRAAQDAAETGDRWLISVAHDFEGLEAWAKHEANIVAEAFGAAVHTTIEVTRRVTKTSPSARPAPASAATVVATSVLDVEVSVVPDSLLSGDPSDEGSCNLDLLPATDHPSQEALCGSNESQPSARAEYSAGLSPVVDALERVVSEHARTGNRTLERDSRFWRLVQLLHVLRPARVEAEDSQTEARGVSGQEVLDKER